MTNPFILCPAVFFFVGDTILFHGCRLENGEDNGLFINHPQSHLEIWDRFYAKTYGVDFDYYPRGRILYRKKDETFLLYCDRCIDSRISALLRIDSHAQFILAHDEHYRCHQCHPLYII
ncbi:MAG: hypothetical protein ACI4I5_04240 [Acutalibacteraceae bacterium]